MNSIDRTSRNLWVGIGCQRGVSKLAIEKAIESIFTEYDLDLATIVGIATIDLKADEVGLVDYCRESGLFLKTYSAERLNSVSVDREDCVARDRAALLVSALVGTPSVAEAAALAAAQTDILLVSKQKFQLDNASKLVTLAVAKVDPSK